MIDFAGSLSSESAVTPGRRTVVTFDLSETVLAEAPWGEARGPKEIRKSSFDGVGTSYGVEQLASGWWGLTPINADVFEQHEALTPAQSGLLTLADFNHIGALTSFPTYRRPTDLPGALNNASDALADEGDHFFNLLRPAGSDYSDTLPFPLHEIHPFPGGTPAPEPPFPLHEIHPLPLNLRTLTAEPHVAFAHVADGLVQIDADTGFLLRWKVPGNPYTKVDWAVRFYFGGRLTDEGLGSFCLLLGGNGQALLYERQDDTSQEPSVARWVERENWRFANPQSTVNTLHQMRILPHARKFIEFSSHVVDQSFSLLSHHGASLTLQPNNATKWVHHVTPANVKKRAKDQPFVTGAGYVSFDIRQDLGVTLQVARLVYRLEAGGMPSGLLVDYPMNIPWGVQSAPFGDVIPIDVRDVSVQTPDPLDSAIRIKLYDGETKAELPLDAGSYTAPGGKNVLVPRIEFATQNKYHSPFLYTYAASRPKVLHTITPGAFTGGSLRELSITGPENDPTHETARIVLHDLNGELPRLAKRGQLSVEIKTEYDNDPAKTAILFRGYARSPRRRPLWREGMEFPTEDWAEYEIECIGAWRRLQASMISRFEWFVNDPDENAVDDQGLRLPWKVTDVLRYMIGSAGYDEDQIDVPDQDMRIWWSPDGSTNDKWYPAPGTKIIDYVQRLAYDYLGAFLLWDPNAGEKGMWRLRPQPVAQTPLWTFLARVGPEDTQGLPHALTSYPDGTSPILRVEGQMTLQSWIEPPEANACLVMGNGLLLPQKGVQHQARQWVINKKSLDWPAFGTTADPDDPDFFGGWFDPVYDFQLGLVDGSKGELAAAWMARRLYDFACRARPMVSFTSHLVLVQDPSDDKLGEGKRRMLRYGDTCLIRNLQGEEETYLIRSVNPDWEKSAVMLQHVQAQKWIPLTA